MYALLFGRHGKQFVLRCLSFILLSVLLLSLCSCSNENDRQIISGFDDLDQEDIKIGSVTGSVYDSIAKEYFPKAEIEYYNSFANMAYLVSQGQLDAFITDEPLARYINNQYPSVSHLDEFLGRAGYAFALPKTDKGIYLKAQLDEFISKISSDGTLELIDSIWFGSDSSKQVVDKSGLTGVNGTLRFATSVESAPFSYIANGEVVGYEVDILYRFCREYGYDVEVHTMDFDAIIPGLGNRYDLAACCMTVTEERQRSVNFSIPDYNGGIVMAVYNGQSDETGFLSSVADSFYNTFVVEGRWKLILQGIGVTLLISVSASVLGTVLGFLLCLMRIIGKKTAKVLVSIYIRIMQGTPIVVLLMILFYIIFAKSGLNGIAVAIIAFAMNFAAYVCEMMHTGIKSVDKGQDEAALAIGFTKWESFFKVVMPQAARQFLPMYKGEFISLVKMTSVVGYIAIQDLTKMSDIIRSRTYDAFFPLISTAVIYFILSYVLSLFIQHVQKKLEPDRKKRTIRGVELQ